MHSPSGAVFRVLIIQLATCLAGIIAICAKNIDITGKTSPRREWLCGHGTDRGEHVFEGLQARDGGFIAMARLGGNQAAPQIYWLSGQMPKENWNGSVSLGKKARMRKGDALLRLRMAMFWAVH